MHEKKPHYFVGDEAFPLQMHLLRPFGSKSLSDAERICNYRLSRARRYRRYCTSPFADSEVNGQLVLGEWPNDIPADTALRPVAELRRRIGTRNSPQRAIAYRNHPKMYVNGEIGSVPWQYNAINK
ncbi:hypothetical protein ILUMI_08395 [Ignelater luminosus]|uniref:DDE Tnp4 domain-containing protein n=1 Tax=Ignelater luminosus TaxID=2038154 RepID=A0A8K0GAP3_IGNLU|nr:hypothetical protein ILUMI_08395 [Ignelater luminosus]